MLYYIIAHTRLFSLFKQAKRCATRPRPAHCSFADSALLPYTDGLYIVYIEYQSVGTGPPLPRKVGGSPLGPKCGGGTHSVAGEEMGGPNSDEGTETLVLYIIL
jgi:hypothetical protein